MIKHLALMLLALPLSFAHATDSGTVPTNQLEANFSISPSDDGTQAVGTVDLFQVSAINGVLHEDPLTIAAGDVIAFAVNGTSATYDATKGEANLPLVPLATYTLTFTRANGESYTSTVTMPDMVKYSTPNPNQVFQNSDTVTVNWVNVQADMTVAIFSTTCQNTAGDPAVNDAFTQAVFPAGYAASCATSSVDFQLVNANSGTGFGTFAAESIAPVNWSYGTPSLRVVHIDRHALSKRIALLHRAHMRHVKLRGPL